MAEKEIKYYGDTKRERSEERKLNRRVVVVVARSGLNVGLE
jgi:hypothetical protein